MSSRRKELMGTIRSCGGRTAAGVPDFRDPTRGVYSMLRDYNLPYPEMVFQLDYFKKHPEPFYRLAKDLYPTTYKPTLCHYLVRMLAEKNLLLRHYTQNVDGLERVAGLPVDKLVEAHGSFATSTCTNAKCATAYPLSYMKGAQTGALAVRIMAVILLFSFSALVRAHCQGRGAALRALRRRHQAGRGVLRRAAADALPPAVRRGFCAL